MKGFTMKRKITTHYLSDKELSELAEDKKTWIGGRDGGLIQGGEHIARSLIEGDVLWASQTVKVVY